MQATAKRKINESTRFDRLIPKPLGDVLALPDGGAVDTVRDMQKIVLETLAQTKELAPELKRATKKDTCAAIWYFVYQNIQYADDKEDTEQLHSPARIWQKRFEGVDCDDMSIFISSLLMNLGIDHLFRIAKYANYWQHVYVVVPDNGLEIIVDPVTDYFNYEVPYKQKKDFQMKREYLRGLPQNFTPTPATKVLELRPMPMQSLGDPTTDGLLSLATGLISDQTANSDSTGGQILNEAVGASSNAIANAQESGQPLKWDEVTGAALQGGLAVAGAAVGLPPEVGALVGKVLNEGLKFLVDTFGGKPKPPKSGVSFNPEDPFHRRWLRYMMDQNLYFNYSYWKWLKKQYDDNVTGGNGKPVQSVSREKFYAGNMVHLFHDDVKHTPNDPATLADFKDWEIKTGRWAGAVMWLAYAAQYVIQFEPELYKELIKKADLEKVAYEQVAYEHFQRSMYNGNDFWRYQSDNWLFTTYLNATGGIWEFDFRYYPYNIPMLAQRSGTGQKWQVDWSDLYFLEWICWRYDRIMKLNDGNKAQKYKDESKTRTRSTVYIVFQYICADIEKQDKYNFKQIASTDADFKAFKDGSGRWKNIKRTKIVMTEGGAIHVRDSGDPMLPNANRYAPIQLDVSDIPNIDPENAVTENGAENGTGGEFLPPTLPTLPGAGSGLPPKTQTPEPDENEEKGLLAWVKKNPLLTLGIVAGGGYGLYSMSKGSSSKPKTRKKSTEKSVSGLPSKATPKRVVFN